MSNMSFPSGIALILLTMATVASIVSMATNHWEDMKIKDLNLPGVTSEYYMYYTYSSMHRKHFSVITLDQ